MQKISRTLTQFAFATIIGLWAAAPVFAAPAYLVGNTPGSRVNVRSGPSTRSAVAHYGLVGDRVQTIDTAIDGEGWIWYYVEFPSSARGWIRGDFINVQLPR